MKPEALARWESTRAKGMARYVLVSGVLSYGIPMFAVMTFVLHRNDLSLKFVGISALLWAFAGVLFGGLMWIVLERQYRNAKNGNVA